jgi:hypothetical protein
MIKMSRKTTNIMKNQENHPITLSLEIISSLRGNFSFIAEPVLTPLQ